MKRSKKDTLISIVILLVFFIQLKRGFNPPELEPGMIPGGLFPSTEGGYCRFGHSVRLASVEHP